MFCFNTVNLKFYNDYSKLYFKHTKKCNKLLTPFISNNYYKLIILTISNPGSISKRLAQRYNKEDFNRNILFIYVIGESNCKKCIHYESKEWRDILYLQIKNSYFNLTYLFIESISWINSKLKYDFLLKWDDDIIVNVPLLLLYINAEVKKLHYRGYMYNKTAICRKKIKICYIPYHIYKYTYIPTFIASGLLILSYTTIQKIEHFHKLYNSYLIRDDQYIGVICNKLSIKPSSLNKYYIRCKMNNIYFHIM